MHIKHRSGFLGEFAMLHRTTLWGEHSRCGLRVFAARLCLVGLCLTVLGACTTRRDTLEWRAYEMPRDPTQTAALERGATDTRYFSTSPYELEYQSIPGQASGAWSGIAGADEDDVHSHPYQSSTRPMPRSNFRRSNGSDASGIYATGHFRNEPSSCFEGFARHGTTVGE